MGCIPLTICGKIWKNSFYNTFFSENRFFKNSDLLTVNNEGGYNNFKLEVKSIFLT